MIHTMSSTHAHPSNVVALQSERDRQDPPDTRHQRLASRTGAWAKRLLDVVVSGLGLVILLPLMGVLALCIRITMGGPVLFCQQRPGLGGESFGLKKFRSMRAARPGEDGPDYDAQRITRLGRFMRSTSLDELPSLLNVLNGDMSLVGPRPLLVRYLVRYSPTQARRHEVRPGITGWAQVNGRNCTTWEERLANDVFYVDNRSFALDLEVLLRTVKPVLFRNGIQHESHETMPEFMGSEHAEPTAADRTKSKGSVFDQAA